MGLRSPSEVVGIHLQGCVPGMPFRASRAMCSCPPHWEDGDPGRGVQLVVVLSSNWGSLCAGDVCVVQWQIFASGKGP